MKPLIPFVFSLSVLGAPLVAQSLEGQITDQLREQGYENVQVTKTWLGRLRIQAASDDQTREIIVNPRTGEILRDFQSSRSGERNVQILQRPAKPQRQGEPKSKDKAQDRAPAPERAPAPDGGRPSNPDGQNGNGGANGPGPSGGPQGPSR